MKLFNLVNKQEIKYLLIASAFSFILFGLVIPMLLQKGIENYNPYLQFIIFNIGIFFFFQIFLKSFVSETKISLKVSFGLLFLFLALDIWSPPLLVSSNGELLSGVVLSGSASDYVMGDIVQRTGLAGFPVYLLTYTLIPLIFLFISSLLLKNLLEEL